MNLLECRAAFTNCTGKKVGRYNYEAVAIYKKNETEFAHRKLLIGFQPKISAFYVQNFELNMEGASIENGRINTPNNPLPKDLEARLLSNIRNIFDSFETLLTCKSKHNNDTDTRYKTLETGQFFIVEVKNIIKIDFDNFIKIHGDKQSIIAENGTIHF
jgi:hypothetical protein